MKKAPQKTGEKKETPTTKKDCNGCHEPEKFSNKGAEEVKKGGAKYNIVDRLRIGENIWIVTFDKWFDCYCTKKTTTVELTIEHGRLPLSKHLIKKGY